MEANSEVLHNYPKFPLWILEYVWAHRMMDVHQAVDFSHWPEVDSQPLSLEDSWRLRVTSAQIYSVVKNRDVEHFERVMEFVEATYRLLPSLVAPVKHMKILFGLKTMVIMWMLREGRGMVDTLFKIIQFFPSKLPQYQDQCSQREMFLMRKNHLDFRTLAQTLVMDKDKREGYIQNQLQEQYGEHYAQRVEDRLLHYLHRLGAVLPRDTYIDKILKKDGPVAEEERLLLNVITSDSATIAATLKKLLRCDVASCRTVRVSQASDGGTEFCGAVCGSSSKAPVRSEVSRGDDFTPDVSPALREDGDIETMESNVGAPTAPGRDVGQVLEEKGDTREEESCEKEKEGMSQSSSEGGSSPQFCSRHQRWVRTILQECPDECSEELLLQANVSLSPPLFQLSSSTSSSQDLTPSNLTSGPPDQQKTPNHPLTVIQGSQHGKPSPGHPESSSSCPQMDSVLQPPSSRDTALPALLSPVVRLIDITSIRGIWPVLKPHEGSSNPSSMSSASGPRVLTSSRTSGNSTFIQPETITSTEPLSTMAEVQTAPVAVSASCPPTVPQSSSRLSRKLMRVHAASRHSQAPEEVSQNLSEGNTLTTFGRSFVVVPDELSVSGPPAGDVTALSGTLASDCTAKQVPTGQVVSPSPQQLLCPSVVSFASNPDSLAVTAHIDQQLRLSQKGQEVQLQSKLLQPNVMLTRLSVQECHRLTNCRSSTTVCAEQGRSHENNEEPEEEDTDSSFDLIAHLFSSSSDSEEFPDSDTEYKPRIRKKKNAV